MPKYQYNQIEDVTPDHRALVESAVGLPIEEIDIVHINEFLNEFIDACNDMLNLMIEGEK
jgi:hypothetical protein